MRTIFIIGNVDSLNPTTWTKEKQFVYEQAEQDLKEMFADESPMIINPLKDTLEYIEDWKTSHTASNVNISFNDLSLKKSLEVIYRRWLSLLQVSTDVYILFDEPGEEKSLLKKHLTDIANKLFLNTIE